MAETVCTWREEDDGDWELLVDGNHFGVLCPHRPTYVTLVWDWGLKTNYAYTIEDGKKLFEKIASATIAKQVAGIAAFNRVWEQED